MKLRLLAVALFSTSLLVACSGDKSTEESSPEVNEKQDIKEIVQNLSTGKNNAESASITSDQLTIKDSDGKEQVMDLPEDEFFVSIAPYINETHP